MEAEIQDIWRGIEIFKEDIWRSPSDVFNLRCSLDIQEDMSNRQLYIGVCISRKIAGLKLLI